MSFNKIILIGNLGRDHELRYTPQGNPVCTFSIATNERTKREGEQRDITTWFRVTLFGKQAETASQYLAKGRPVYIEGRLRLEEYTDKEGKQRHSLEVIASDMQFIGGRDDASHETSGDRTSRVEPASRAASAPASSQSPQRGGAPPAAEPNDDSDIPF